MEALQALTSRVSVAVLDVPGPTPAQLELLLQAALRAPDHGVVRPWRFIVIEGDDRRRFGDILCTAKQAMDPLVTPAELEKLATKPFRAPMILVAVAEVDERHRVPVLEQVVSTGAAVQNIMVAAHALGLGAMWRTGALASHPVVKQALGFADKDEIVGFVYLGTPAGSVKAVPQADARHYLRGFPGD